MPSRAERPHRYPKHSGETKGASQDRQEARAQQERMV